MFTRIMALAITVVLLGFEIVWLTPTLDVCYHVSS